MLDGRAMTVCTAEAATAFAGANFLHVRNASLSRFTLDRLMKILGALAGQSPVTVQVDPQSTGW